MNAIHQRSTLRFAMPNLHNSFLMAVPSPRNYLPFYDSIQKINYIDIFLAKYMEVVTAMTVIRDFFLDGNYDYLMICQDDYQVPLLAPYKIMLDVEYHNFDVVCGWCQIGADPNITNIGDIPRIIYINNLNKRIPHFQRYLYKTKEIFSFLLDDQRFLKVNFTGHTLCAMSRDVVKKWTPRAWYFHTTDTNRRFILHDDVWGGWAGCDDWFSYEMMEKQVPIYADLTVFVKHDAPDYDNLLVRKRQPTTEFFSASQS